MSIHDELERIAARAPAVVVPTDTWGRAQRARRRQRYGVVAVILGIIAVAGTLAWLPTRDGIDAVGTRGEVGVPSRLQTVPERFTNTTGYGEWSSDEVTDDVTVVKVGAAAWLSGWPALPVVVDAERGAYHLLDLPDFIGSGEQATYLASPAIALSPDGRRLAYAYAVIGPEAETEPVPSGIRVVDLTTGEVREVPVLGEEGTEVTRIEWSPDGRWIAFLGTQQSWWTGTSRGTSRYLDDAGPVVGRIAPGADVAETRAVRGHDVFLRVDDAGVTSFGRATLQRWEGDSVSRVAGDGSDLARDLGTLADGSRLVLGGEARRRVEVIDGRRRRQVIRLDASIGATLSVAVDLMDPRDPTIERPAPEWPTDWEAVATQVAWIAIPGAFLLMLLLPWLRRRLSAGRPTTGPAAR